MQSGEEQGPKSHSHVLWPICDHWCFLGMHFLSPPCNLAGSPSFKKSQHCSLLWCILESISFSPCNHENLRTAYLWPFDVFLKSMFLSPCRNHSNTLRPLCEHLINFGIYLTLCCNQSGGGRWMACRWRVIACSSVMPGEWCPRIGSWLHWVCKSGSEWSSPWVGPLSIKPNPELYPGVDLQFGGCAKNRLLHVDLIRKGNLENMSRIQDFMKEF